MEAGGCAIDMDHDGWTDLYLASASGTPNAQDSSPNRIFRNVQGEYVDVSALAGVGDSGFAQGVSFGDVNEDGFHDILVMNYGLNFLLINNGDGTFSRRDDWFPVDAPESWSTSGALADLNLDGITDLICTNYCAGMEAVENPCYDSKGIESACWPTKFSAQRDDFYAGTTEGHLESVAERWGFTAAKPGRGLGIIVGALDNVAGQDIYIANDMTSNHFWTPVNGDAFSMIETATLKGVALDGRFRPQASMGIAVSDLDNDDDVDLYVTNFEQEYNTLYKQSSLGIWQDETQQSGLANVSFYTLGFGTQALDFDNDGKDEIAVANGHLNKDAEPPSSFAQKFQVLRQRLRGVFELVQLPNDNSYASSDHVGRSMWKLDANRDGLVDLAITHQFESLALLINQTPSENAWSIFD